MTDHLTKRAYGTRQDLIPTKIVGGDARRVIIEKTVERNNHVGFKIVRISLPRMPTLHGEYRPEVVA